MRTYVIEPQLMFSSYLERCLSGAGLEVIATNHDIDGRDIAAHDPAAIFVDVDFFERGGPNALCRIRQAPKSAHLIAYSSSDDPTYAALCYISGANAVISKRAGEELLIAGVRQALKST
jgi:DNA-binding NarL/FixJ family response regulator